MDRPDKTDHFPFVIGHFSLVIRYPVKGSTKASIWAKQPNGKCSHPSYLHHLPQNVREHLPPWRETRREVG